MDALAAFRYKFLHCPSTRLAMTRCPSTKHGISARRSFRHQALHHSRFARFNTTPTDTLPHQIMRGQSVHSKARFYCTRTRGDRFGITLTAPVSMGCSITCTVSFHEQTLPQLWFGWATLPQYARCYHDTSTYAAPRQNKSITKSRFLALAQIVSAQALHHSRFARFNTLPHQIMRGQSVRSKA
jgi:hypothetical protein